MTNNKYKRNSSFSSFLSLIFKALFDFIGYPFYFHILKSVLDNNYIMIFDKLQDVKKSHYYDSEEIYIFLLIFYYNFSYMIILNFDC